MAKNEKPKKQKNLDLGDNGYPQTDIKTDGIKVRGTGAATKGLKARGRMG